MINQTIALAIRREMPSQPDDDESWRQLFLATARRWRDEMMADQVNDMSRTVRAIDKIIKYFS